MGKHQVSSGVGGAHQASLTLISGPSSVGAARGREGILGLASQALLPDGGMLKDMRNRIQPQFHLNLNPWGQGK